jgi:hypothetical protein
VIIRELKPETTIRLWKTQKEKLKNTIGKNTHYGARYISHIPSTMVAKKQPKIAY